MLLIQSVLQCFKWCLPLSPRLTALEIYWLIWFRICKMTDFLCTFLGDFSVPICLKLLEKSLEAKSNINKFICGLCMTDTLKNTCFITIKDKVHQSAQIVHKNTWYYRCSNFCSIFKFYLARNVQKIVSYAWNNFMI